MAEKGQTRDPSSHRTPGQIKRMDRGYNARPEHIKRRDADKKARKMLGLKSETRATPLTSRDTAQAEQQPKPTEASTQKQEPGLA